MPTEIVAMATILDGVAKLDWGFYSREEDRMHLQVVGPRGSPNYKVFLEREGKRVFEPAKDREPPPIVDKALRKALARDLHIVEAEWLDRLIKTKKILVKLHPATETATVDVYPGTRDKIHRTIILATHATVDEYDSAEKWRLDGDLSALVLNADKDKRKQVYIYLPDVIWGG